jgi:hypothetical protein
VTTARAFRWSADPAVTIVVNLNPAAREATRLLLGAGPGAEMERQIVEITPPKHHPKTLC